MALSERLHFTHPWLAFPLIVSLYMKEEFKCSNSVCYEVSLTVSMPVEMKFLPLRLSFIVGWAASEASIALAVLVEMLSLKVVKAVHALSSCLFLVANVVLAPCNPLGAAAKYLSSPKQERSCNVVQLVVFVSLPGCRSALQPHSHWWSSIKSKLLCTHSHWDCTCWHFPLAVQYLNQSSVPS